jgi:serine/threonine-protein kinase HipA
MNKANMMKTNNTHTLTVYLNQTTKQKVGTLAQKDKKIYFEYDKEFIKSGIELSPYKLPLRSGLFVSDDMTFEGLWGVFADSLPDGWGRLLADREFLRRGINLADISPLDRLAMIGEHGMGALSYEPTNESQTIIDDIILDDLAQSSNNILKGSSEELIDELFALGGSSAGARPKILVQVSDDYQDIIDCKKPLLDKYSHYIIKFASVHDTCEVALVEYVYNQMAKLAHLDVPEFHLFKGKSAYYFGAKRFDRIGNQKLHMHSLAGLTHSDFRYPTLDYDDLLRLTLHLTKSFKEQEAMFRLACFNLMANNRDDHAKNFSYILDDTYNWTLSPTYDLTYSFGPNSEHSTIYLGEGKNPTIKHLEKLANKNGIKNYQIIIEEVKEAVSKWQELAKDIGINRTKINQIQKSIDSIN